MRLRCEAEVVRRQQQPPGPRGRSARALLSLGRPRGSAGACLLLCTARDRAGARYGLRDNVERFFTRFVDEGKATVRLREPPVDLCLSKANASSLKAFLSAVRLAHQGTNIETLPLSALVPAKTSEVEKPKTKMIITSRRDYPLTKNFPYSLEHLQASYCKLARIDTRVLCLKKLRKLDLSHNHIKQLPATIGDLTCLQELILRDNHLESFSGALCNSTLQKSLQFLDKRKKKTADPALKQLPLLHLGLKSRPGKARGGWELVTYHVPGMGTALFTPSLAGKPT
ncbi:leucine-rich repeat protein 1-like [Phaenicophaeus curvirostris]|uniref:leucine-rich repeat protein 1-like n=1 Tax=Phaenicophaeus curvirostris TaxID=33595 RepID=UPI0037F0E5D8